MTDNGPWGLTPAELRKLRSLKTPYGIQAGGPGNRTLLNSRWCLVQAPLGRAR
jgi:hypothetical protein